MSKETIGEYLKRERELRQISLEEVAEGTKIGISQLRSLEGDKLEDLHAEVFVQGFIKSYSDFIGLAPEEALLRYQEERTKNPPTPESMTPVSHTNYLKKSKPRGPLLLLITFLLLLGLSAAAGYWYYWREDARPLSDASDRGTKTPESLLVIPEETLPAEDVPVRNAPEELNDAAMDAKAAADENAPDGIPPNTSPSP